MRRDELYHYGVQGQKWGIRRFQYEDGTLTPEGKERYGSRTGKKVAKAVGKTIEKGAKAVGKAAWKGTKAVGSGLGRAIGRKFMRMVPPVLMSDEAIAKGIARINMEENLKSALRKSKSNPEKADYVKKTVDRIMDGTSSKISTKVLDTMFHEDEYEKDLKKKEREYQVESEMRRRHSDYKPRKNLGDYSEDEIDSEYRRRHNID